MSLATASQQRAILAWTFTKSWFSKIFTARLHSKFITKTSLKMLSNLSMSLHYRAMD